MEETLDMTEIERVLPISISNSLIKTALNHNLHFTFYSSVL